MIHLRGHHLGLLYGYMMSSQNEDSLSNKKSAILSASREDGHSRKHGLNIISILQRIIDARENVKLTDGLDDICSTCNSKGKRSCKEFIPYGVSATCEDRATLHYYGLCRRTYTAKFIQKRLREKGSY